MRRIVTAVAGIVAVIGIAAWSANSAGAQAAQQKLSGPAARGQYLVTAMGCGDCHTPAKMGVNGPEPDMARLLSGHPGGALPAGPQLSGPWMASVSATFTGWSGPWGISYTANLTPDKETGLGTWTEQQFIDTIRMGRHQGRGRELLPPMPWPAFRNLTDADLKAVFAYLRAIPPVVNKVPDPMIATVK